MHALRSGAFAVAAARRRLPMRVGRLFSASPVAPLPSTDKANADVAAASAAAASAAAAAADESIMSVIQSVLSAGKAARQEKKQREELAVAGGVASADAAATAPPPKLGKEELGRLFALVRPEATPLAVSVATLGFTTAISLIFPYAIGEILDVALKPDAVYSTGAISLGLLGLFGVQSAMIVVRSALLSVSGERMAAHIRKDLFRAILSQETAWFDRHRTGDIINRVSADSVVIQKALTTNVANGLRSAAMVAGCTGMLFYLSPSLALLSLGLIPPVALGGMYYGRYLQGQQKAVQEALGRTMEVAEEAVSALRTVRQFGAEAREAARFSARVDESYRSARRIGVVAGAFDGAVHMAANVSLIAVLWHGGNLVAGGALTAGELTAFLMYSLYTGFNVSSLSNVYTELRRAAGAAARVFEVLHRHPAMPLTADAAFWARPLAPQQAGAFPAAAAAEELTEPQLLALLDAPAVRGDASAVLRRRASPLVGAAREAVTAPGLLRLPSRLRGAVSFSGVRFAYPMRPETEVLRGLTLDVPAGRAVSLVGGSGSGKSTVGALLTRLYDAGAGSVSVDGHDVRTLDPVWLRSQIAVVSQEPALFAASIADNIRYGRPRASDAEVEDAARRAHLHEAIAAMPQGYATPVGQRGQLLSGGQRQRLAIARALLLDAPILLCDEATSALDAEAEHAVLQALAAARAGRTCITIAHRLSTIRHAGDLVAVLEGGVIAEVGAFEALFADPRSAFRQLIKKQAADGGGGDVKLPPPEAAV